MTAARPHLLTLMFLTGTACLDIVFCGPGMDRAATRNLATGLLIGQMFAVGGWLALGRPHRLFRGAVFVGVVIALTTIITFAVDRGSAEWGRIFAVVIVFSAVPAAAAGLVKFVAWRVSVHRGRSSTTDVRFPLLEIFGWMIVVAVASAVLRLADFGELASPAAELMMLLSSSAVAGVIYALAYNWRAPLRGLRLAASIILFVLFQVFVAMQLRQQEMPALFSWAFAFLVVWLMVECFVQTSAPREAEATRAVAPTSGAAPDSPWGAAVEAQVDVDAP